MKKKWWFPFFLICVITVQFLFSVTGKGETKEETPKNLYAREVCLMDAESGRVLFEKNGNERVAMASTTKMMTCLIVLEQANLDDIVTVSHYASTMPDVQLNIREGEQYYVKDLLYSLMLESHNDTAVALAEHVGGSVEGFADKMNQKAEELGLVDTHFVTPNGLDAEGHYTTAIELCKIAAECLKNETFLSIISQRSWSFSEIHDKRQFTVNNKDRFLDLYGGALGIKTGFTGNAGYCFVGAVEKDDMTLISAVLGCGWPPNKNYKWVDTTKLMDYGYQNFSKKEIFDSEIMLSPIQIRKGKKESVSLQYEGSIFLPVKEEERIIALYKIPPSLQAPVREKEVIGCADYYIAGEKVASVDIYTKETALEKTFSDILREVLSCFLNNMD